mmetsp:Transcript_32781/g.77708  ORF Transcript_32781/g.77708 Transcript_32781/m.77708 type:complete len:745 (+) Transcript_32781:269-2503(+)
MSKLKSFKLLTRLFWAVLYLSLNSVPISSQIVPPWPCSRDQIASVLNLCLESFQVERISTYFKVKEQSSRVLCEITNQAINVWGTCLEKSSCVTTQNKDWLQKSCEEKGLVFSLLSLHDVPNGCDIDCSIIFSDVDRGDKTNSVSSVFQENRTALPVDSDESSTQVAERKHQLENPYFSASKGFCSLSTCENHQHRADDPCSQGIEQCVVRCGGTFCFESSGSVSVTAHTLKNSTSKANGYCSWSGCTGYAEGSSWCNESPENCIAGCGAPLFCYREHNVESANRSEESLSAIPGKINEGFCSWGSCKVGDNSSEWCDLDAYNCMFGCGGEVYCFRNESRRPLYREHMVPAWPVYPPFPGLCYSGGCNDTVARVALCHENPENCFDTCEGDEFCFRDGLRGTIRKSDFKAGPTPQPVIQYPLDRTRDTGYCNFEGCTNRVRQGSDWCNESPETCVLGCGGTFCFDNPSLKPLTADDLGDLQSPTPPEPVYGTCEEDAAAQYRACWLDYARSLPGEDAAREAFCQRHKHALQELAECLLRTIPCFSVSEAVAVRRRCSSKDFLPLCDLECGRLFSSGATGLSALGHAGTLGAETAPGGATRTPPAEQRPASSMSVQMDWSAMRLPPPGGNCSDYVALLLQPALGGDPCEGEANLRRAVTECLRGGCYSSRGSLGDLRALCRSAYAEIGPELARAGCRGAAQDPPCDLLPEGGEAEPPTPEPSSVRPARRPRALAAAAGLALSALF